MQKLSRYLLPGGAALFALLAFGLSFWRWWTFQYATFDLAFYVQGLWLALRGHGTVSLLGVSLMGNHGEPILYLLLPLFAICPHPMLLPALQIAALATMPFTARRIARRLGFERREQILLALATLLAPATGYIAIHEFHPEAFAAPLVLLLYEARQRMKYRQYLGWFVLVLCCKENLALLLIAWQLVYTWIDRERRQTSRLTWDFAPLILAVLWFIVYTSSVSPWLNHGRVDYGNLYSGLGSSAPDALEKFFLQPQYFWGSLWQGLTQGNMAGVMLLSSGGLILLRPRWLLIALPILLQHLLSWRSSEWTIYYHYGAPLVPLCWLAAAEAASDLQANPRWAYAPALACLFLQPVWGPVRELAGEWRTRRLHAWNRAWKAPLVREIAADRSTTVVCGMPYLSHLAMRGNLYSLHLVLKGLQTLSRERYEPDYDPDVVLLDYGDTATFNKAGSYYHPPGTVNGQPLPSSERLLASFLAKKTWTAQSVNELTILREAAPAPPPAGEPSASDTVTEAKLTPEGGRSARLVTDWTLAQPRATVPWQRLLLHGPAGDFSLLLGMAAPQAAGVTAHEERALRLPSWLPAGTYSARLVWHDQMLALWGKGDRSPILGAKAVGELTVK